MSEQQWRPHGERIRRSDAGHPWADTGDAPTAGAATYNIDHQQAAEIYQAGRDQYNERNYQLRIAPMLDRARRRLRIGIALMLAATAVYLVVFVLFGREIIEWNEAIFDSAQTGQQPDLPEISFAPLALLPVAFITGFVGFVMAVTALMARRRAHQEERRR